MTVQGHPRSLILAPVESAYMTSYWTSIANFMTAFERQKPLFRYPPPIPAKILGCFPWSRSALLGSAENEHPKLTNREIIIEDCELM